VSDAYVRVHGELRQIFKDGRLEWDKSRDNAQDRPGLSSHIREAMQP